MKNHKLIIILVACISISACHKKGNSLAEYLKVVDKIELNPTFVKNPIKIIINSNNIFISDFNVEESIKKFNLDGEFLGSFARQGQGPGEVSSVARFAGFYKDNIIISSAGRAHLFNFNDLTYKTTLTVKNVYAYRPQIFNNMMLVKSNNKTAFVVSYTIDNNLNGIQNDVLYFGLFNEVEELLGCEENPLYKQGPVYNDNNERIFFSFKFTSLIIGFNQTGEVIFKTLKPYDTPFPPIYKRDGATFTSAPINKHPEINIALAGDDKYIYSLYSGTILKKQKDIVFKRHELGQGEIIDIYDKQTSQYLGSHKLPYPARDMVATEKWLYILSVDPEVCIYKLKKPFE